MKKEAEHRPFLLVFGGLIVGLVPVSQPWHLLFLLPLFWLAGYNGHRFAIALACAAGWFLHAQPPDFVKDSRPYEGVVTLASTTRIYDDAQTAEATTAEGHRYRLRLRPDLVVALGDQLRVTGVLRPLREADEPIARSQGIEGVLIPDDLEVVAKGPWYFQWGDAWRRGFLKYVGTYADGTTAATLDALCFNATWNLDESTWTNLRRTGTTHIISASGLHVVVLGAALAIALIRLPVPRPVQLLLLLLVLCVFAGAAGLRPPIVRSVLMVGIGAWSYLLRRETDWLSALAVAGIITLLVEPAAVYDIGFQLSYVLVGGITMVVPLRLDAEAGLAKRLKYWLITGLEASCWATVVSLPLVAYHFGGFSIVSPIANLLIAPALPYIMVPAMLGQFAAGVPWLASLALGIPNILVGWLQFVLDRLGSLPFAYVETPEFSAYWIPLYYALFLAAFWRFRARPA